MRLGSKMRMDLSQTPNNPLAVRAAFGPDNETTAIGRWTWSTHCLSSPRSYALEPALPAGALRHQPFAHAMQRLEIELLAGLGRHEPHGRALHCLGDWPPHHGSRSSVPWNTAARTWLASAEGRGRAP